jgi:nucleotide-binding universal stress UspA family protein
MRRLVANMATAQLSNTGVSIHTVLIATDFSRPSSAAMSHGFELARRYQAETHLVFVTPTEDYMLAVPESIGYARDAARRDLLELQDELKQNFDYEEGSDYHAHLLEGPVADSILDCARKRHADLIVLGTHGRGSLGKMLMGSVAEQIFRHSSIPVLTIGPNARHRNVEPKNIVLATNCSPASERAAHYACSLAREHHSILTVVHALEHVPEHAQCDRERITQAVIEKLAELIAKDSGGFDVRYEVGYGPPLRVILHAAMDCGADYLVLGVHQRPGLLDRFMWPTAYGVVREASCPVLTVRCSA